MKNDAFSDRYRKKSMGQENTQNIQGFANNGKIKVPWATLFFGFPGISWVPDKL
jgi:hypothetical protein